MGLNNLLGYGRMPAGFVKRQVQTGGNKIMGSKTRALIEQHFHGAYGVNFSTCSKDDVLMLAQKLKQKNGIGGIFPTLITDSLTNIRRQIEVRKSAALETTSSIAEILGIHIEGVFINPRRKGVHNARQIIEPSIENYKKIEDDFIRIVTLSPERCRKFAQKTGQGNLMDYLKKKGVKVQAGHCEASDLSGCDGVTHLFNAMSPVNHHVGTESTALRALVSDKLYTEVIGDGLHLSDDALKLVFRSKPADKILLISDCLPNAGLSPKECPSFDFAGKTIYWDGEKSFDKDGVLAGSAKLLSEIIKIISSKKIVKDAQIEQFINNPYEYHGITKDLGEVSWDSAWNIVRK